MTGRVAIHPLRTSRRLATACGVMLVAAFAGAAVVSGAAAKAGSGKPGGMKLKSVGRFQAPVYVTAAPGVKGVYVVEQPGRIRFVAKGKRRTFLNIRDRVLFGGEQGLLSVAFPRNHARSGLFYVYYVTKGGDLAIEQYRRKSAKRAKRSSARRILTVAHPGQSNHNGGQLQFGPDGLLYAATGDGGGAGDPDDSAQDPHSLLGKILRINPNPGGRPSTVIRASGLRNPFRFSFDTFSAKRPRIVIGDVGQNSFEEVNYEAFSRLGGANFGWNDFEGFAPFAGAISPGPSRHDRPIKVRALSGGRCALIGGYVVRNRSLKRVLGRYVYGDFCTGELRSFVPTLKRARKDRGLGLRVPMLSSFGEGPGGKLYATSLNGPVLRFVAKGKRKGKG